MTPIPPRPRWQTTLRAILLVATLLLALDFLAVVGFCLVAPTSSADAAIVLGNEVKADGTPAKRLTARLQKACDLYSFELCKKIIVSGGVGKSGFDESLVMKAWLVERGIPPENILTDSKGVNSRRTAENAKLLMEENNLHGAVVVSQYWHLPRSVLACWQAGIAPLSSAAPRYHEMRDLYSIAREMVGLPVYLLKIR